MRPEPSTTSSETYRLEEWESVTSHRGVEVEFEDLARGATEFVCSRTTALADSAD